MAAYAEFDNLASNSKYPFADSCSLEGLSGSVLPNGFLVDLSICLYADSVPYLSKLSEGVGIISANGEAVAQFSYSGPGSADVVDIESGLKIGVAVLGTAASGIEEMEFDDGAAVFAPACFCLFPPDSVVTSVSDNDGSVKLHGNIRIFGKNGVYVTKYGANKLRIDIIGSLSSPTRCCEVPIQGVVVISCNCPVVAGVATEYASIDPDGSAGIIPGVIALRSSLTVDAVCGKKEQQIKPDGTIDTGYCDPMPIHHDVEGCLDDLPPQIIIPSNGSIDFIPYSSTAEGGSPVVVETEPAGAAAAANYTAGLSSPSVKNLAIVAGSGSISIGLKGRN